MAVRDARANAVEREIGYGCVRFERLAGFTGAPRDVLTTRLRRLEEVGVLEPRIYSERPPRFEYHLTEAGVQLRPIVLALKEWGDQQLNPGAAPVIFEHTCGAEFHPRTVCATCGEPVGTRELVVTGGTHPVKGEPWYCRRPSAGNQDGYSSRCFPPSASVDSGLRVRLTIPIAALAATVATGDASIQGPTSNDASAYRFHTERDPGRPRRPPQPSASPRTTAGTCRGLPTSAGNRGDWI